jgi:hypothetical protein
MKKSIQLIVTVAVAFSVGKVFASAPEESKNAPAAVAPAPASTAEVPAPTNEKKPVMKKAARKDGEWRMTPPPPPPPDPLEKKSPAK